MNNIVIIGSSGHAKVVVDIVEKEGRYRIVGFLDPFRAAGEQTMGYPVLGREDDLPALVLAHDIKGAIVAIGDNFTRAQVAGRIKEICPQLPFVTAIHPSASVASEVSIAEGTVVMAGACINSCCSIGRCCIVNTNASLDHDGVLDDFSSLAPGAVLGGNCRIGYCTAVSIGAVVLHGVHVGEHSLIGAGAVLLQSFGSHAVAYGVPAKHIRQRQQGEKYL